MGDLIERLKSSAQAFREHPIFTMDGDPVYLTVQADECDEAAARIRALEGENARLKEEAEQMSDQIWDSIPKWEARDIEARAQAAEASLAKAVEGLEKIAGIGTRQVTTRIGDAWSSDGWNDQEIVSDEAVVARETLASIRAKREGEEQGSARTDPSSEGTLADPIGGLSDGWRDISSAAHRPRESNFVLGEPIYALIPYTPDPQWTVAWWDEGDMCFRHVGDDGPMDIQPTHWQPLPPPPNGLLGDEG